MNNSQKTLALALSGAFALSVATTTVNAAENPFSATTLSAGYQVADGHEKMKDGKCGTGKCGANKAKMEKEHEGKCSAEKAAEGSCSAEKAHEGSCSGEKGKEGSCHADK